jgi:hypothetical protein
MSTKYEVFVESFADRHYIRTFAKKYKKAWDFTFSVLKEEFEKFDFLLQRTIAEEITDRNADVVICKTEFKISGTQESRHGSGNRCIVAKHTKTKKICVLLVYNKNNIGNGNETTKWKNIIRDNYPEYADFLK